MAELLLELFSEEIPARMQARAAEDLRRLVTEGLKAQGLEAGDAKAFATPRRLTLVVEGVPAKSPDISEERKGPRVNAPEHAIAGFVKAAGLKSIKEALVVKDDRKGDFYVVRIEKPGRAAKEIVADVAQSQRTYSVICARQTSTVVGRGELPDGHPADVVLEGSLLSAEGGR